MDIVERFLNYVSFDTQSAEDSQTVPSTAKQLDFANISEMNSKTRALMMLRWTTTATFMPH